MGLRWILPYPQAYAVEGTARALLDLLDELNIERPAFVGYLMGGQPGLYLALRHPEQCVRLFVEPASPGLEDAVERRARREADEERTRGLKSPDFEAFLKDWTAAALRVAVAA